MVVRNMQNNSDKRIRGAKLQKIRIALFKREPMCRRCLASGFATIAEHVDHIIPLYAGGEDIDSNRQPLCISCHKLKTIEDYELYMGVVTVGLDGYPVTSK